MYLALTDAQIKQADSYGTFKVAETLAQLSYNQVSDVLTGGSTGTDADTFVFVAPCKMKITDFKVIVDTPNVGASNTPTVKLMKGTDVIAATAAVALSGAAGDVKAGTIDQSKNTINKGDVLKIRITTPSSTVTTALKARGQIEWNATV